MKLTRAQREQARFFGRVNPLDEAAVARWHRKMAEQRANLLRRWGDEEGDGAA